MKSESPVLIPGLRLFLNTNPKYPPLFLSLYTFLYKISRFLFFQPSIFIPLMPDKWIFVYIKYARQKIKTPLKYFF